MAKKSSEQFRNSKRRIPRKTKHQPEQKAKRTNRIAIYYRTPEPEAGQPHASVTP